MSPAVEDLPTIEILGDVEQGFITVNGTPLPSLPKKFQPTTDRNIPLTAEFLTFWEEQIPGLLDWFVEEHKKHLHEKEAQSICEKDISTIPKARATFIDRWVELEERRRAQAGSDPRSLTEEDLNIESVADNTIDDDSDGK